MLQYFPFIVYDVSSKQRVRQSLSFPTSRHLENNTTSGNTLLHTPETSSPLFLPQNWALTHFKFKNSLSSLPLSHCSETKVKWYLRILVVLPPTVVAMRSGIFSVWVIGCKDSGASHGSQWTSSSRMDSRWTLPLFRSFRILRIFLWLASPFMASFPMPFISPASIEFPISPLEVNRFWFDPSKWGFIYFCPKNRVDAS